VGIDFVFIGIKNGFRISRCDSYSSKIAIWENRKYRYGTLLISCISGNRTEPLIILTVFKRFCMNRTFLEAIFYLLPIISVVPIDFFNVVDILLFLNPQLREIGE